MNPFEVLGIASSATVDEIEARWRELALAVHPDQYHGTDPAERARRTEAMATINAARHAALAARRSRDAPAGATDTTAGTAGQGPAPTAERSREPDPPGAARFIVATVLGVLALLVGAMGVVVWVAVQGSTTTSDSPSGSTTGGSSAPVAPPTTLFVEWDLGACISAGEFVVPVDCSVPNAGRIVLRTTAPEFCPDWAEAFVRVDADVWCVDEST